jgi:fumarate hydratase class II
VKTTRTEHDALGAVEVPAERLWGAQTQRSLDLFAISTERMPDELILALAAVKRAAARVNGQLGLLAENKVVAIVAATDEILAGRHPDEFPLSVWQTGSATQTHMNLNEVVANRAAEILHGERGAGRCVDAHDEVNLGQSSNDVVPTAMHLAAACGITRKLLPSLVRLQATLAAKAEEFAEIMKLGRTHLQDATPLTLGQEFSGYAAQLDQAHQAISAALPALYPLAIGGTAVGTGLNAHPQFGARVAEELAQSFELPFTSAANKFAAQAAHDALVGVHGTLKGLAVALLKIANDIRWLASGPRSGIGEITLPANEPGSSMMPGKVNPTQCEALVMLCCQVIANDVAVSLGGASGQFELNACKPLLAHNLLQSLRLLADGMGSFEAHCVRGIAPCRERIAENLERSLMLVTALVPQLGHERAATLAQTAQRNGSSLREAAIQLGYLSADEFDRLLQPMLQPARE